MFQNFANYKYSDTYIDIIFAENWMKTVAVMNHFEKCNCIWSCGIKYIKRIMFERGPKFNTQYSSITSPE